MSFTNPFDVLRDLQDRVTALEKQAGDIPGADSLQPNVITVAADGTIGADFTGVVKATGLYLPSSAGPQPANTNRIQWTRARDGAMLAQIYADDGTGNPGATSIHVQSVDPDGTNATSAVLEAVDNIGNAQAALSVQREVDATPHRITAFAGQGRATIIDSSFNSTFLQLASGAQRLSLARGQAVLTWPGGSPNSNLLAINHGLGRVPVGVVVQGAAMSDGSGPAWTRGQINDNVSFYASAKVDYSPAAGSTLGINWIAIG